MKQFLKNWWTGIKYGPEDPRFMTGGVLKVAAIGGGTGLANVLRGLKYYTSDISAIVTVADNGGSAGEIRKEFDMVSPGDIRRSIAALAYNEDLIFELFNHRFAKDNKLFGGHTLGNIWISALTDHYGSFEKAIEVTSEIFRTAGKVLPATLDDVDLAIEYEDGTKVEGERFLDEIVKRPKTISLTNKKAQGYRKAVEALAEANLILIGPGSLYGSLIPNLLFPQIVEALKNNKKAVKVYIANCSTERTQTAEYSVKDHIQALIDHAGGKIFDYCLVNDRIVSTSKKESEIGEVNNITTDEETILGCKVVKADMVDEKQPLFHNPEKLASAIVDLYNKARR